jgi:hypothetical protein
MLALAGVATAGFALANKERLIGPSLNRWDETIVLLGFAAVIRATAD